MAVNRVVLNGISCHGKGTIQEISGSPKAASVDDFKALFRRIM